jgi:hypothetical protein
MARWLLSVLLFLGVSACATYVATSGGVVITDGSRGASVAFSADDRAAIRDHFRSVNLGRKGLPRGLGKGDRLPDGIVLERLPVGLERRLSPLPANYLRARVGRDVVIVDRENRFIADTLFAVGAN